MSTSTAAQQQEPVVQHASNVLLVPMKVELETRKLFDVLTNAWKSDAHVKLSASPKAVLENSAYCYLIDIGAAILPLVFEDYEREDSAWPVALNRIVGKSPVKAEHRGKARLIREDWLNWGRENGYLRKR